MFHLNIKCLLLQDKTKKPLQSKPEWEIRKKGKEISKKRIEKCGKIWHNKSIRKAGGKRSKMPRTSGYTKTNRFHCLEDLRNDTIDFALIYCGTEKCRPGHRFGPNRRETYVMHIVTGGRGKLEVNGGIYELEQNDAFILYPNESAYYEADSREPWSYMWVGFDGVMAFEMLTNAGFSRKAPVRHLNGETTDILGEHIEQMLSASALNFANELKRNGYLMLFFSDLVESNHAAHLMPSDGDTSGSVYVRNAMDYMTHHYGEKIRINELADQIGVNRSYLTSSFKRTVGVSPQEFLVTLRMEKASCMLQNTRLPINAIAERVGYEDSLAFSKIFKKYYGLSPKQYRESPMELVIAKEKGQYQNQSKL